MARTSESRLQRVLIPEAGEPSVLSQLVEMDRLDDQPFDPPGAPPCLTWRGRGGRCGISWLRARQSPALPRGRIVRGQQDATLGLDGKDAIARGQVETLGHVLWQGCANGATDLPESDFFGHCLSPLIDPVHRSIFVCSTEVLSGQARRGGDVGGESSRKDKGEETPAHPGHCGGSNKKDTTVKPDSTANR